MCDKQEETETAASDVGIALLQDMKFFLVTALRPDCTVQEQRP